MKMSEKDKQLMFKDLCARLPYRPYVQTKRYKFPIELCYLSLDNVPDIKPYLRRISSMTKKEQKTLSKLFTFGSTLRDAVKAQDYLNSIHIDYRNLLEKDLALEAPKDMYDIK